MRVGTVAATVAAIISVVVLSAGMKSGRSIGVDTGTGPLAIALGTFVSEDLACLGAGALASQGQLSIPGALWGCFAGILAGDLALFHLARVAGRPLLRRWPLTALVVPAALERSSAWVQAHGARAVLVSRFIPGTRLPTHLAAGLLGLSTLRYWTASILAVAAWTPLIVGSSLLAGSAAGAPARGAPSLGPGLVVLLLAAGLWALRLVATAGRRRAVRSRWRRTTRWEFWPPWVVYPAVVVWIVWLGLRHRALTVFTAANPGMPAGGFVGESKSDILSALERGGAPVAAFATLSGEQPPAERIASADALVREHGLPVVLKPDTGQRGSGVRIVRSIGDLHDHLRTLAGAWILQAFVSGPEFGVFYARVPGEPRGRIVSLTDKRLPFVVGDGHRTIEQLIWADPRAVALGRLYCRANAGRLTSVPGSGVAVSIAEIGSHCRGAVFLDGAHLVTPGIEAAIEAAACAHPGFAFGRFDVRATSVEAFQAGCFRILELNGVTSEPTHIYDPRHGLAYGLRTLASTWSLAFRIGAEQRARGARVWTVRELVALAWRFWRGDPAPRAAASPGASVAARTLRARVPPA